MFDIDIWQEILSTIKKNKMRTFLTGFSVAWGIFMLIVLLGAGNGLSNGVSENFSNNAINSMWLYSGRTSVPYKGLKENRHIQLTNSDYSLLQKIPEIEYISGNLHYYGSTFSYGSEYGKYTIISCQPQAQHIECIQTTKGRFINEVDINQSRKSIVIGEDISNALFNKKDPIGQYIKIKNVPFKVVGVCKEGGSTRNRFAYIPITTGQKIFQQTKNLNNFSLTLNANTMEETAAAEKKIRALLAQKHKFKESDRSALGSYNRQKDYFETLQVFTTIKIFIWIIGIGTLIAGIVGVSNIMLISVKERTKEIGIRKAIGASPLSVIGLIICESIFITTIAGYIGLVLGTGLMEFLNIFAEQHYASSSVTNAGNGNILFRNPTVNINIAAIATLLLIIAGTIAGYIPAKKATKIKPIEALRSE